MLYPVSLATAASSRKLLALGTALMAALFLSACSEDASTTQATESAGIPLPQAMQRATFPSNAELSATITIDDESPREMSISNNAVSFSTSVAEGPRTFVLELFYEAPGIERLRLVRAQKSQNITGSTSITFA